MGHPNGVDDVENRSSHRGNHLSAGFSKTGVMTKTALAVGHGEHAIKVLEGCRNLGTVHIVMLEHRDVDQFEVLAVSTAIPNTILQLNTITATTGETGIGDVLVCPVTICDVIIRVDNCATYGVKEIA